MSIVIHSIIFVPAFRLRRVVGSAPLGGPPEISHAQEQCQIDPLGPQDGAKEGRRCSHTTWSLDDLWAAFLWVWAARVANLTVTLWSNGRTNVSGISRLEKVP